MKYRLIATLPVYIVLYSASLTLAFLLRFDLELNAEAAGRLLESLPWVLAIKASVFTLTREWRRRHRYTTLNDIASIVATASFSTMLLSFGYAAGLLEHVLPRTVIAIDWALTILATCLLRSAVRFGLESH